MDIRTWFSVFPDQFKNYLLFFRKHQIFKWQLILFLLILSLLPTQNYYAQFKAVEGRAVVRTADLDLPEPEPYPVNSTGVNPPLLSSYAALVIDLPSRAIIYQKNPDFQLFPASTTKIMTGLVALEHWPLDEVLEIGLIDYVGQVMELELGERITVENILYGLLVHSGNDAALALAQNYPGGEVEFVARMNKKAEELNMFETHFSNPTGLESWDHIITVHDLGVLTAAALENKTFAKMVATKKVIVYSEGGEIIHELENINELLGEVEGLKGVKTGWTENSGECLVAYIERDGRKIITIVLKSADRFGETRSLVDWVFTNFNWEETSF